MNLSRRTLTAGLTAASSTLLTSCGTIFYPDRRTSRKDGTMGGEIDIMILALDAVGLFFFLVPGIIAFAVDFGTGAIFLPEGGEQMDGDEKTIFDEMNEQARIQTPVQPARIETVLHEKTGKRINLQEQPLLALEINDIREAGIANTRLSANHLLAAR